MVSKSDIDCRLFLRLFDVKRQLVPLKVFQAHADGVSSVSASVSMWSGEKGSVETTSVTRKETV
jgi:hypothetical protein